MKNTFKIKAMLRIAGVIAFVAVIGFSFVSYDDSSKGNDGSLNGTWVKAPYSITISGSSYTSETSGEFSTLTKGTVSYKDGDITFKTTHVWDSGNWVPYSETISGKYSVSGNTATFTSFSDSSSNGTWTKQ